MKSASYSNAVGECCALKQVRIEFAGLSIKYIILLIQGKGLKLTVVTMASFQAGRCHIQRIVGPRIESSIISKASAI